MSVESDLKKDGIIVIKKIDKKMGIVGFNSQDYMEFKTNTNEEIPASSENLTLEPIKYMDQYFGAAMFFYKEAYTKIPKDIKIVYGDCWLIHFCKKQKRTNYRINGQTIYHIGSLSSAEKKLINICKNDSKLFKKDGRKKLSCHYRSDFIYDGRICRVK